MISPQYAFTKQKNNAKHRGIEWRMTFAEWWAIWEASGKWEQRGRTGDSYVMARHGDVGPYSPSNVSIVQFRANLSEARRADGAPGLRTLRGQLRASARDRAQRARALRAAGESFDAIAAKMSVHPITVRNYCKRTAD